MCVRERLSAFGEVVRIVEEVVLACLEVLSWHSLGGLRK
jgi:hypothetical protein